MEPALKNNDFAIIEDIKDPKPNNGDMVVSRDGKNTLIRHFYLDPKETVSILEPLNPAYAKKVFTALGDLELRGIVRGSLWKGFFQL